MRTVQPAEMDSDDLTKEQAEKLRDRIGEMRPFFNNLVDRMYKRGFPADDRIFPGGHPGSRRAAHALGVAALPELRRLARLADRAEPEVSKDGRGLSKEKPRRANRDSDSRGAALDRLSRH